MDFNVLMCRDIRDCVTPSVAISSQTQSSSFEFSKASARRRTGWARAPRSLSRVSSVDMEATNVAALLCALAHMRTLMCLNRAGLIPAHGVHPICDAFACERSDDHGHGTDQALCDRPA